MAGGARPASALPQPTTAGAARFPAFGNNGPKAVPRLEKTVPRRCQVNSRQFAHRCERWHAGSQLGGYAGKRNAICVLL